MSVQQELARAHILTWTESELLVPALEVFWHYKKHQERLKEEQKQLSNAGEGGGGPLKKLMSRIDKLRGR